ncbi:MAG TPA: peptidase M28 [Phycisphaerales bacterium]|nr:peptidase M28 [Phycisphaerales bacterium]
MWEQIRANKRNSIVLLITMAMVLCGLGYVIGGAFSGPDVNGGPFGLIIAGIIWVVLLIISFVGGDQILLMTSKAVPVTAEVHPQLFNVVEEMTIAANLPKMPKIYIINEQAPNAFATGRSPESASVAVTAGLLARLNRDELQGVIAHEVSHILHRDILFVTLAGVMLGSIVLVSQVFLRGMFYSSMTSGRRYSSRSSGGGQGQIIMIVVAIVCAILAPIFANILYFALSRKREYLADAGAVRLTRYPEGLAGALEKISGSDIKLESANKVTAPMYIANPLKGMKAVSLFSTHPPIDARIKTLRMMSRGASFKDYSDSYSQTVGGKNIMPASVMKASEDVAIRQADKNAKAESNARKQMRQTGDIMRMVNGFAFITCACGMKLKVPPNFKAKQVACPRCKRNLQVPKKTA